MKKSVVFVLVGFLSLFLLTACGTKKEKEDNGKDEIKDNNVYRTLACNVNNNEDGVLAIGEINVNFVNDKAKTYKANVVTEGISEEAKSYWPYMVSIIDSVMEMFEGKTGAVATSKKEIYKLTYTIDVEYDKIVLSEWSDGEELPTGWDVSYDEAKLSLEETGYICE